MKKRLSLLLAAALLVTGLAACGGNNNGGGSQSSSNSQGGGGEVATSDDTIYGLDRAETFVFGAAQDCKTLDPMLSNQRFGTSVVHFHISDVLAWRGDDGVITYKMAESVEQIEPTVWEVKLRSGVKAHDGSELTTQDVYYSFMERGKDPDYAAYQLPAEVGLTDVEIIDDLTCRLITAEPTTTMEFWMFEAPIVPHEYYSSNDADFVADNPVGFGPYKFVEWVRDDHLILERNDDYWGDKAPIKNLVFRVIPEESARVNELIAGNVDFAESISIDLASQCDSDVSHLDAQEGLRKLALTISIEKGNPALADKRVRQALNYAINKDEICETLYSGTTSAYNSYVNPPNNNKSLSPYPYDPEKAKQLLAEAGYADGLELTLSAPSARYGLDREITMQMAAYLEEVGVKVDLNYMELGTFLDQLDAHELTDLVWIGWAALVNPTVENLILTSGHVDNSATWSNSQFDEIYGKLASELDSAKATEYNMQLQEIAWEECPWVWLWKLPQYNGMNNRVKWDVRCDGYYDLFNASFQ